MLPRIRALKSTISCACGRVLLTALLASWTTAACAREGLLVLGVFPRHNYTETQEMFRPLAKYLSEALGREVRLETARDYETFWSGVAARRYDIVHLSQSQYVAAQLSHGYRVILKNEEFGESTLASVIVVRADSGITRLDQLKGRTVMFGGDRSATMSYLVPREMLAGRGCRRTATAPSSRSIRRMR
jgi:phosphonate transport system substrate-binding protein